MGVYEYGNAGGRVITSGQQSGRILLSSSIAEPGGECSPESAQACINTGPVITASNAASKKLLKLRIEFSDFDCTKIRENLNTEGKKVEFLLFTAGILVSDYDLFSGFGVVLQLIVG